MLIIALSVSFSKFLLRPADPPQTPVIHWVVYYEAVEVIQTMGAERLTFTGLVMGSALATWAALCLEPRV